MLAVPAIGGKELWEQTALRVQLHLPQSGAKRWRSSGLPVVALVDFGQLTEETFALHARGG